jgi:hypothetical protein
MPPRAPTPTCCEPVDCGRTSGVSIRWAAALLLSLAASCGSDGQSADANATGGAGALDAGAEATSSGGSAGAEAGGGGAAASSPGGSAGALADAGPCDPPNTVEVNGTCVPSCGTAGGNTCVASGSTLCEGLPLITSHDCAVCCARPQYPGPVGARSFHIVHKDFPYHWDSILALASQYSTVSIASQNKPDSVPQDRWTKMLHTSAQPTGAALAANVNALLVDVATAPSMVMVDELNGNTVATIAELAQTMRTQYPQWQGRWGAFTTVFTGGQPAIDELLSAHAHIAVERYIEQSWYCSHGANGGERDISLATFFDGDASLARYDWLVQRKAVMQSQSPLSVVFGVTDRYMDGTNPAIYLDRMFYVWVTRTKHPGAIAIANGGPGGWKWDPNHPPGGYGTSNTSRDQAFAASVDWYSVQGKTTSRLGPVPCP